MASDKSLSGAARGAGMSVRRNPSFGKNSSTGKYRYNIRGKRSNMWARTAAEARKLIGGAKRAGA